MQTVKASDFKARCLAILDRVARTGEGVTILKRGKPVAQLLPAVPREKRFPQHTLQGTVKVLGDIVAPALPPEAWEAESKRS
ncbi:MAG: type II toxin-antitoxin system Phd/YefM family antitoxin [Planctomycetes bacterium]|nr:type II toxin-antitoxin system Phd/YefM family antitoxin [Planctomycetota bacterium]